MGSGRMGATMSITLRPNLNFATKADNTSVNWDELKGRLSSFQVDKLTYFFTQFFDHNQDGVIDSKDFAGLTRGCERLPAGSWTTRSTWPCATTTESSLSAFLSRRMPRETLKDLRTGPGSKRWHQARWSLTRSLSTPGSTCGRECARARQASMTPHLGPIDSKGDLQRDLQQRRRADHQSVVSQELLRKLHRTVWRHPGESFH